MKSRLEELKTNHEFRKGEGWEITTLPEDIDWLIEQTEKVERYEKALKFFANKEHYEPFREEDEDRTDAFNFIDLDGGETAREVLEGKTNTVDIVEYEGKRWSVIGGTDTHYIATEPYEEMDGDTIKIPKNEAIIIK